MNDKMIQDTLLVTPALLVPLLPLIGFLINGLFGKFLPKSITGWIAALAILGSFICSIALFNGINSTSSLNIDIFDWIAFSNISISFGFLIDPLTITMLLVVTGIGFLIHLYSIGYMKDDEGFTRFFTYLNLFIFFIFALSFSFVLNEKSKSLESFADSMTGFFLCHIIYLKD